MDKQSKIDYLPKLELLSNIIAFASSNEYTPTLTNLARDCNVPLQYMRNAIVALLSNRVVRNILNKDHDDDDTITVLFGDNPVETVQRINNGEFDNYCWDMKISETYLLALSSTERKLIKQLGEISFSIYQDNMYVVKDNSHPESEDVRKRQEFINNEIISERSIAFKYKNSEGIIKAVSCFPHMIITDLTFHRLYLLASTDSVEKYYRLDRIVSEISECDDCARCTQIAENRQYKWGIYDKDEQPTHVKVYIATTDDIIISKIQNETNSRRETCTLTDYGNHYIYEDDIIGWLEFKRWVQSYGEYMKVLEPQKLHDEIEDTARKTLDLYERSKEWYELFY